MTAHGSVRPRKFDVFPIGILAATYETRTYPHLAPFNENPMLIRLFALPAALLALALFLAASSAQSPI
ncbi:hypothetical protein CKO51_21495 [Rhodopirellula sp. SM50]|nr:hypothetical protein CKO51_21495 [Rhodopirellula sp. SM50]